MSGFMWMRTPQHALDVIAYLIESQASVEEQDRWLAACIKLGYYESGDTE